MAYAYWSLCLVIGFALGLSGFYVAALVLPLGIAMGGMATLIPPPGRLIRRSEATQEG